MKDTGIGGTNPNTDSASVGATTGGNTSANAGAEAIAAAANAAQVFNNFASTIEAVMAKLGINPETGKSTLEEKASDIDQLKQQWALAEPRLNAHQGLIQFLQGEVGGLKIQVARLTDTFTMPARISGGPATPTID